MKLDDLCPHCFSGVASVESKVAGPIFHFRCGHVIRISGSVIITLNTCPDADFEIKFKERHHAAAARVSKASA